MRRLNLTELVDYFNQKSVNAGWWPDELKQNELVVPLKIALIHSELSEALEGHRKDKMDDHLPDRKAIEVELADALIRIFDLAGHLNLDLEGAVFDKDAYNDRRADHKKEAREAPGGKKY